VLKEPHRTPLAITLLVISYVPQIATWIRRIAQGREYLTTLGSPRRGDNIT
jgi:hypothetical protein